MHILFKGGNIAYTTIGKGKSVIFLHGLLESKEMWQAFIPELSKTHQVICIDLLGHGETSCLGYVHTMTAMSQAVLAVIDYLKITSFYLVGHSMGGYVALALAYSHPERILGLCLMNSTFTPDTNERRLLRTRAIKMAKLHYENLVRMSFTNLFSNSSKARFKTVINKVLNQALKTPLQGYIASNEGMKLRPDLSVFFRETTIKKLILLGEEDEVINTKDLLAFCKLNHIPFSILKGGHMSYIEDEQNSLKQIISFL